MRKKKIMIISIALCAVVFVGCILAVTVLKEDKQPNDGTAFNELFVKDVLSNKTVDDIINDSRWGENLADATDNYFMVNADKFELSKEMNAGNGYSMLYFDMDTGDIEMIQHSYVSFTDNKEPKTEIEKLVANIDTNISALLGGPQRSFMLMNRSGDFKDYGGLTVDEMIDSILKDETVMYAMYECNGIKYEMNILYADNTIYTYVWTYEKGAGHEEHSH